MTDVWNMPTKQRVLIKFNKAFQLIEVEGDMFQRFLSTVARMRHVCPLNYKIWHKMQQLYKDDCWLAVKVLFFNLKCL